MKSRGYLTSVTENYLHAYGVGYVSYILATRFKVDPLKAFVAGTLHDLGGAIPNEKRIAVAESLGIELSGEERSVPLLIHAKLGKYFAQYLFNINDEDVLNAILFHTTCINQASPLVKIVFLADKIRWDRNGRPPYLDGLLMALEDSLDDGCAYFLRWLWASDLYIIHPYLSRSYGEYVEGKQMPNVQVQDFSELTQEIDPMIKKQYFLNEIHQEFENAFQHGCTAKKIAKSCHVNPLEAYVTSALVNMTHTIQDGELQKIARILKLDVHYPVRSQLNWTFARDEYGITNLEVLSALKNFPQVPRDRNTLAWVVAKSWESKGKVKREVEND